MKAIDFANRNWLSTLFNNRISKTRTLQLLIFDLSICNCGDNNGVENRSDLYLFIPQKKRVDNLYIKNWLNNDFQNLKMASAYFVFHHSINLILYLCGLI